MIHTLPAQPTEIAGDDIDTKQTIQIKAMTPIAKMLLPSLSTHSRLTVLCIAKKKTVCVSRVCVFVCGRFGRIKKHKREM